MFLSNSFVCFYWLIFPEAGMCFCTYLVYHGDLVLVITLCTRCDQIKGGGKLVDDMTKVTTTLI